MSDSDKELIRKHIQIDLSNLNRERQIIENLQEGFKARWIHLNVLASKAGLLNDEDIKMYLDINKPEKNK